MILLRCHRASSEINTIPASNKVTMDQLTVSSLLKIVDPFLMISSVAWFQDKRIAKGNLRVTEETWFYQCHFTDTGIMPGVLQTESMLQTIVSSLCYEHSITGKDCLLNKSSVSFLGKVQGAGLLDVNAEISCEVNGLVSAKAELSFNDQKKATGNFRFVLPSKFMSPGD